MKSLIKKLIPKFIFQFYHKVFALMAGFIYRYPANKMIVVGVTGTNGKTSASYFIAKALEASGEKVGLTTTAIFKIGEKEWLNNKKMTMLGRMQLQKMLKKMLKAGCKYAVIETSSQGIEQFRHLGINYDYLVFTNLTPEHIEAHGGFENYKKAKLKLFKFLTQRPVKEIDGKKIEKTVVLNINDKHWEEFNQFKAGKRFGFGILNSKIYADERSDLDKFLLAKDVKADLGGLSFKVKDNLEFNLKILGEVNVYNILPAVIIACQEGIDKDNVKKSLEKITGLPGRMEMIDEGQKFSVLVDYAPEPESMRKLYKTIEKIKKPQRGTSEVGIKNVIHVLGSAGGGRDKARRPVLGKLVGENADYVIVTNEDPYDEDPQKIIDQVVEGALEKGKIIDKNLFNILDRKDAIKKALSLAKENDLVLITGKGCEQAMCVANGRMIKWDDRKVVRELLTLLKKDVSI